MSQFSSTHSHEQVRKKQLIVYFGKMRNAEEIKEEKQIKEEYQRLKGNIKQRKIEKKKAQQEALNVEQNKFVGVDENGSKVMEISLLGVEDRIDGTQAQPSVPKKEDLILKGNIKESKMVQKKAQQEALNVEQNKLDEVDENRNQVMEIQFLGDGEEINGTQAQPSVPKKEVLLIEEEESSEESDDDAENLVRPQIEAVNGTNVIDFRDHLDKIESVTEGDEFNVLYWLKLKALTVEDKNNNMTFLNFGKKPTRPTLQFSVQKISKTEDMVLKYDPIKNEKHKEVEYIDIDEKTEFKETFFPLCVNYITKDKKQGKLVSECQLQPNSLYMVRFQVASGDDQTTLTLFINEKIEAEVSLNQKIYLNFGTCVAGSDVSSAPLQGVLSDLVLFNILIEASHHMMSCKFMEEGQRCHQLRQEKMIDGLIERDHGISGHPRSYLRDYKYEGMEENYTEDLMTPLNGQKENEELHKIIDEQEDKSLSELKEERIKDDVDDWVHNQFESDPEFFNTLELLCSSRKWLIRALSLYSPGVDAHKQSKVEFKSIHNTLSQNNINEHEYPFYPISLAHFHYVSNQAAPIDQVYRQKLLELGHISQSLYYTSNNEPYLLYDRLLHYLCNADGIKPLGLQRKSEDENSDADGEGEEEAQPEVIQDGPEENADENEKDGDEDPQEMYNGNFFVGSPDPEVLDLDLTEFRKRFGYRMEDLVMYSATFSHLEEFDEAKFESIKFTYLQKTDKNKTWEQVYEYIGAMTKSISSDVEGKDQYFKLVEWPCPLVPQRTNIDGTFDTEDVLHTFKEGQKRKSTTVLINDLLSLKMSAQEGIFYSLRMDMREKDHTSRVRVEFRKPPLQESDEDQATPGKDVRSDGGAEEQEQIQESSKLRDYFYNGMEHTPRYGLAVINRNHEFIGFGLYDDVEAAILELRPELNDVPPIEHFRDVMAAHNIGNLDIACNRVNQAKFSWNKERLVAIEIMGERKATERDEWPSQSKANQALDSKKEENKDDRKKKATKSKKKNEEEKISEEDRNKEDFHIKFLHPVTVRRLEDEARVLAEQKEKEKETKGKKKAKKSHNKNKKRGDDKAKAPVLDPREAIEEEKTIDLNILQKIRIDYSYGRIHKFVFIHKDESAEVVILAKPQPPVDEAQQQGETMGQVTGEPQDPENPGIIHQGIDQVQEFGKSAMGIAKGGAEPQSQHTAAGEGNEQQEPQTREELIEGEAYTETYIIGEDGISGFYARFGEELSDIQFWGAEREEPDSNEDEENQMEDNEDNQDEEESVVPEKPPRITDGDDFMDSLVDCKKINIRLIFNITYHVKIARPPKDEDKQMKMTDTVNEKKFNSVIFEAKFEQVSEQIKKIIPNAEVYGNFEKSNYIGEFTVYAFGLCPEGKTVYFSNVDKKKRFPSEARLYYLIIDELIKYDDFKLIEQKQQEYFQRKNIILG